MERRASSILVLASLTLGACSGQVTDVGRAEAAPEAAPSSTTVLPTTAAPTTTATTTTTTQPGPGAPARSAGEIAERISATEAMVRDPATAPDALADAAFELQLLYRQLGRSPEWDAPVLEAVPDAYRLSVTANTAARRLFRAMHTELSDTLPAWRIVDPPPAEQLLAYYREAEAAFGVPWEILAAVNLVETGMGRIRGTSIAGAQGPMQFLPSTWEHFGEGDINDPHDAIMGAARYLAHNGGGAGDIDNALWNYNHHDNYVQGVKAYASVMEQDPEMFRAFYHWQVVYLSELGDIWLPTGYEQTERIPVADYVAAEPTHLLGTATN